MAALVFRILGRAVLTLLLLTACVFFVLHLTGDPARLMLGSDASAEAIAAFRHQWGLDKPLWEQFGIYLLNALSLDMGMIPTAIVTLLIGIPAGVFAALRRNTTADRAMMVASVMGYAVPNFFMGILLLLVFSIWLGWLPSYGNATAAHYIMPIITMATTEAAIFSRYARSAMIESMRLPSVKAAMMRGLPRTRIIWLHALPNAMLSILTILGFFLGTLVAGAVITETVFSWPGVGKLLVQSVANRDIPVVQMIVLATGASLIAANLLMDLLALVFNPRLRKGN